MPVKTLKSQNLTWVNIDKLDDESLQYLKTNYKFHHLDYEDLIGDRQTPKIDVYKNYLFLVLHYPQWQNEGKKIISHEVDVFIGDDYLITVQHTKSKEIKDLFYKCSKNKKTKSSWLDKGSGYLLYKITEQLLKNAQPIVDNIGQQISALENHIYSGDQTIQDVRQLAIHRRNILKLRRIVDPQKYLISNLSHIRRSFLEENLAPYFDDIGDYLNKIWSITDTYKDTIDGLHVTVESFINHRTNKVISALTVISVALLPLTLLSGIYGMNITGLPHAQNPFWVWMMFLGLLTFILLVIWVMKKRKWL